MPASVDSSYRISQGTDVPPPPFRWVTRVGLPVAVLAGFAALFAGSMAESLTPAVVVDVVPAVERPAIARTAHGGEAAGGERAVAVQAAGWIEPDPFAVVATALTDGSVEEVLFLEGDTVERGQPLVRLVADDARLALRRAEADFRAAEEAWEANIEARREAEVTAARVREAAAALDLAGADLEVERSLLREAERIHNRRESLVSNGSVSREEYDSAAAAAEAQAARVRVMERRIDELEAQLDRARVEAGAAARHLELRTEARRHLELTRVALDEARLRVERLEVRSPIDGVVMRRFVAPGSMLTAVSDNPEAARVAEIYDPEKLQVRVDVPLADAGKVSAGQEARIVVEVMPDHTFTGRVTRITNLADIQKNTLEVKVAVADPLPALRPEMLARVRFLDPPRNAGAATTGGGRSVFAPEGTINGGAAWVVTGFDGEHGVLARRVVTTTGATAEGWEEVESGLRPGDLLVVPAEGELRPNQKVRIRKGRE